MYIIYYNTYNRTSFHGYRADISRTPWSCRAVHTQTLSLAHVRCYNIMKYKDNALMLQKPPCLADLMVYYVYNYCCEHIMLLLLRYTFRNRRRRISRTTSSGETGRVIVADNLYRSFSKQILSSHKHGLVSDK